MSLITAIPRVLSVAILVLFLLTSLNNVTFSQSAPKISVAVTLPYLASIVKAIGGDKVSVVYLIPPGVDPHDYEPPYSKLIDELRSASIVFMTGPSHLALESRIYSLKRSGLISSEVVDYRVYESYGLTLLKNPRTGTINPHGYIFSFSGIIAVAKAIYHELASVDPADSKYFKIRLDAYIQLLNNEKKVASETPHVNVALATPILMYAVKDLGLNLTFILLPSVEVEPSQSDINMLKNLIKNGKVSIFLISDIIRSKDPKIVSELKDNGINPVTIHVSKYVSMPEGIPIEISNSLRTFTPNIILSKGCPFGLTLLVSGLVAEASVIVLLLVLLYKWRKAVIEALCNKFAAGEQHE